MRVNEIFYSLQGEGFLAGTPSTFIRLPGCPLRCKWCDTKYAWDEDTGTHYSIETIIETVNQNKCQFVVITGGEPMLSADLPDLTDRIKANGNHITIETAGIAATPGIICDLMSISPKLSNSTPADPELVAVHEDSRLDIAVIGVLMDDYNYQLKFVVDSKDDLLEIDDTIDRLANVDRSKIMLMPQAQNRDELLEKAPMVAQLCKQTGFAFSQRLQILIWDNQRGT